MIKFVDFANPDGSTDWDGYNKARVAAGEQCYRCGGMILSGPPCKSLCWSCKEMDRDRGKVTHESYIRCPMCGHQDNISDWDCDSSEAKYSDGDHYVECSECDHEYMITTHALYEYTSPARDEEEDQP